MNENRQNERVALDVKVDLKDSGHFHRVRSRDLSSGGLFIEMEQPSEVGSEIALLLRLKKQHVIHAKAVVCWVKNHTEDLDEESTSGVGVAFTHLDVQDRVDLENVITAVLKQSANENKEDSNQCLVG